MNKQIILFGAGNYGKEALDFFGAENVFCFADNNPNITGSLVNGKKIISAADLQKLFNEKKLFADIMFEVVITPFSTRWVMYAIAKQLIRMGIEDFSVYRDIRRRWSNGEDFIKRDRTVYPCEQESVLEIYKYQFRYMLRHTDPTAMLPASGEVREQQLAAIANTYSFFGAVKELDIKPFMISGTLIGAVRHKGFIPWDDDLDFALLGDEYDRLVDHCQKHMKIFHREIGTDTWLSSEGETFCDPEKYPFVIAESFGYIQIYRNKGQFHVKSNKWVCDIHPIRYINDSFSKEDYVNEFHYWKLKRKENFEYVEAVYKDQIKWKNIFVKQGNKCGYEFDLTSFLEYFISYNGRDFSRKIWDIKNLLPLKKMPFEGYEFYAPCNADAWLREEGFENYMALPDRTGVYVHDKERLFSEDY